jgi:hypothetical protein
MKLLEKKATDLLNHLIRSVAMKKTFVYLGLRVEYPGIDTSARIVFACLAE